MSDIIADIDELIDEQLDAGEPEIGYSFGDPKFPMCPRGCGRRWHGMAVTTVCMPHWGCRRFLDKSRPVRI